jgi:hypothetical protein
VTLTDAQTAALERLKNGERIGLFIGCGTFAFWVDQEGGKNLGERFDVMALGDLVRLGVVTQVKDYGRGVSLYGITERGRAVLAGNDPHAGMRSQLTRQMVAAQRIAREDGCCPTLKALMRRVVLARFEDLRDLGYGREAHNALCRMDEPLGSRDAA